MRETILGCRLPVGYANHPFPRWAQTLNINVFWSLAQARVVIGDWQAAAVYATRCGHR